MKFDAAIHGVDLDKDSKDGKEKVSENALTFMFPHPDEMQGMSEEEKEANTKKQMEFHKASLPKQMRM